MNYFHMPLEAYIQCVLNADTSTLQNILQDLESELLPKYQRANPLTFYLNHAFNTFGGLILNDEERQLQRDDHNNHNNNNNCDDDESANLFEEDQMLENLAHGQNSLLLRVHLLHHRFHLSKLIETSSSTPSVSSSSSSINLNLNTPKKSQQQRQHQNKNKNTNTNTNTTNNNFVFENENQNDFFLLRFNRLFEILYYSQLALRSTLCLKKAANPLYDNLQNTDIGLFRFRSINYEDCDPHQQLLIYLNYCLVEAGYRRQNEQCMQRRLTPEGYDTHVWVPVKTIEKFVAEKTCQTHNFTQWANMTKRNATFKWAVDQLKQSQDIFFIDVKKDRRYISFRDGIYCTQIKKKEYNENGHLIATTYTDRWYQHEFETVDINNDNNDNDNDNDNNDNDNNNNNNNDNDDDIVFSSAELNSRVTACNYIDQVLNYKENIQPYKDNWYLIPTPHFQKILDYQQLPKDVCKWMYILCGRLLHDLHVMDNWQVLPFIKGVAGSGKSTILLEICQKFFAPEDVGTLSNNCERKFGLSALVDKLLYVAPEYGKSGIEQSEFQMMISGENISIAKKFETAISRQWKVPGIMAGNEHPGYQDHQGSIARRMILFLFNHHVNNRDPKMKDNLKEELPLLIIKMNRAYLDAVEKYGKYDLWKKGVLPQYFLETQGDMSEQINPLVNFLNQCPLLKFGKRYYCSFTHFTQLYNDYVRNNNLQRHKFNKDYYDQPLKKKGCLVKTELRNDPLNAGRRRNGRWIDGVKILNELDEESENEDDDDKIVDKNLEEEEEEENNNKEEHQQQHQQQQDHQNKSQCEQTTASQKFFMLS